MKLDEMSQGKTGFSLSVLEVAKDAGIPIRTEKDRAHLTRIVKFLSKMGWTTCESVNTDTVSITEVGSRVAKALVEFFTVPKK
jgi:hypothetical protein